MVSKTQAEIHSKVSFFFFTEFHIFDNKTPLLWQHCNVSASVKHTSSDVQLDVLFNELKIFVLSVIVLEIRAEIRSKVGLMFLINKNDLLPLTACKCLVFPSHFSQA